MTPRQIILANLNHQNPDRPGFAFGPAWDAQGNSVPRLNDILMSGLDGSPTWKGRRWTEGNKEYYDDEWGNVWVRMKEGSQGGEVHEPALKNWSQLDSLQAPDYDDDRRYEAMRGAFSRPTDKFKVAFIPGWVFATSRYLRTMEIYFCDLIEYRPEIDRLHEIVTGLLERVIHKVGQAGAEGIFFCEDLGVQDRVLIGPPMWRDVFKPYYRRLTAAAHEHGMKVIQHSCGYNWELIDELADAGIDCFQFDQPANYDMPALAAKLQKHKVALYAPVDIQKVMPTGDRRFIEDEAKRMVDTFRGCLICTNYGDLKGIGVKGEWDMWAYDALLRACGLDPDEVQAKVRDEAERAKAAAKK